MIKMIRDWLGFGTNWKSLLIRSQEAILESVVKLNTLMFLRPDEIETYTSPMKFLHDSSVFADEQVVVYKGEKLIAKGTCIGYGTLINNIVEFDGFGSHVVANIKKFYVVHENDENKYITLEEGVTIDYAGYNKNL